VILYNQRFDNTATYLIAGQYIVAGQSGNDIALFGANVNVPTPLNWTNQSKITSVNRSQGVTVTWDPTTGDPAGYVYITGSSTAGTNAANTVGAQFTCSAPIAAGTFTVPPNVLLALPATVTVSGFTVPGTLAVSGIAAPVLFQAGGLDFGFANDAVVISTSVSYQ